MNQPKLERVHEISVFEQALKQIRDAILNNQYRPKEKLPTIVDLSKILGVSHITIKQVLSVLEAEGLIESRRGSGVFVTENSKWKLTQGNVIRRYAQRDESMLQMLDIRGAIEGMATSIVAENPSDKLISELESIIKEQLQQSENNASVEDISALDIRFHTIIAAASSNAFAEEIVSHLAPAFAYSKNDMLWTKPYLSDAIQDHIRILEAIKSRDEIKAGKEMQDHLARVKTVVEESHKSEHTENES